MFSSQEAVHAVTDRRVTTLMLMFSTRQTSACIHSPADVRPVALSLLPKDNFMGFCLRFRRNASIFVSSYYLPRDLTSLSMRILFFSHRLDLSPKAFCPFDIFMFEWGGDCAIHTNIFVFPPPGG